MRSNLRSIRRVFFGVAVIVCLATGPVWAGTAWLQRQKLLASDGAAGDNFGTLVSISGDYAIVGTPFDDDNGSESGSAYIFKRDGAGWSQQAKLIASDGAAKDYFGNVSISGDYAIVGAGGDDDNGTDSGSAYIFKRNGASWSEQAKLLASDGAAGDWFGYPTSISGDYAIVGAHQDDDNGESSGSAYIFKRDGAGWSQQAKLLASDGASYDEFGYSVSISGDYAIVGACFDGDNGYASGSAYIFKSNGASWSEQAKLVASDGASGDYFGYSVSISGDYAIVGAYGHDDNGGASGSAYIFKRDGASWPEQAKLRASDGAAGDYFGLSVSISGDYAIVGASRDDDDKGSAYIFKREGESWSEQAKLVASDGAAKDWFGKVSISGNYAIVGAYSDDDNGTNSGSAYIFGKVLCPASDLTNDCFVDFEDLGVLSGQWLLEEIPVDVWPDGGDGIVNFFDWAVFANQWQITVDYEALADFAGQWLKTGANYYIADIAPAPDGDGIVNMLDFAALAENWLAGL